jgi:hypothetical protein
VRSAETVNGYGKAGERRMVKIKGIYDGKHVRLLEPVHLVPDTLVEVLIPELAGEEGQDRTFLERLVKEGLLLAR